MSRKTTFFERAVMNASLYERGHRFLSKTIWQYDVKKLPERWQRTGVLALRVIYLGGRGLMSSRTQLQASSLTYVTMLALVPAFAVVFSVFQGFGGLDQPAARVKEFIVDAIAANPSQAQTIAEKMDELVLGAQKHINSGSSIAGLALVFLVLTVVSLLSSIEKTLNDVWEVKRSRSFIQKFMTYWAIATLGPVLLGIALIAGTSLQTSVGSKVSGYFDRWKTTQPAKPVETTEAPADDDFHFQGLGGVFARRHAQLTREGSELSPDDEVRYLLTGAKPTPAEEQQQRGFRLTSFFLTAVAFFILYAFMPNTKVKMKPAMLGGFIAAAAWTTSKWALARSSTSLVQYNTIYGGLATIPIMMFWLYITWLIVIVGAELTFAIQNIGSQGREELAQEASTRCREIVALRVMTVIAEAFERGAQPPVLSALALKIGAPLTLVSTIVFHLCEDGLLREVEEASAEETRGYVPAKPLALISLGDIARSLEERQGISFDLESGPEASLIADALALSDQARDSVAGKVSLEEVVRRLRAAAPVAAPTSAATPEKRRDSAKLGSAASAGNPAPQETGAAPT